MSAAARPITRFLASVRTADEARIALAGGADIIDAKEPAAGALGAVAPAGIAAILAATRGARPVSATIGDCPLEEAAARVHGTAGTGVDYVKIGLFGAASEQALAELADFAAADIRLIAVMFADRAPDLSTVGRLAAAGFAGVMLDTAAKGKGLRAHMAPPALAEFLAQARGHGLLAGLAGSLSAADVAALLPLGPDVLGFRGALCAGARREGALDIDKVRAMRHLIGAEHAAIV